MSIGVDPAQSNGPVNVLIAGSAPGLKGDPGVGISTAQVDDKGQLVITKTDGSLITLPLDAVIGLAAMQAATTLGTSLDDINAAVQKTSSATQTVLDAQKGVSTAQLDVAAKFAAVSQLSGQVSGDRQTTLQAAGSAQAVTAGAAGVLAQMTALATLVADNPAQFTNRGAWDAAKNSPVLTSGAGSEGDLYVVSVAGATALDGVAQWGLLDGAWYHDGAWHRLANAGYPTIAQMFTALQGIVTDRVRLDSKTSQALAVRDVMGYLLSAIDGAGNIRTAGKQLLLGSTLLDCDAKGEWLFGQRDAAGNIAWGVRQDGSPAFPATAGRADLGPVTIVGSSPAGGLMIKDKAGFVTLDTSGTYGSGDDFPAAEIAARDQMQLARSAATMSGPGDLLRARPVWGISVVVTLGQSEQMGFAAVPVLTRVQPYDNVSFGGDARGQRFDDSTTAWTPRGGSALQPLVCVMVNNADFNEYTRGYSPISAQPADVTVTPLATSDGSTQASVSTSDASVDFTKLFAVGDTIQFAGFSGAAAGMNQGDGEYWDPFAEILSLTASTLTILARGISNTLVPVAVSKAAGVTISILWVGGMYHGEQNSVTMLNVFRGLQLKQRGMPQDLSRRLALISTCVSGMPLANLSKGQDQDVYQRNVQSAQVAVAESKALGMTCGIFLWDFLQGGSDTATDYDTYYALLKAYHEDLIADVLPVYGQTEIPFFMLTPISGENMPSTGHMDVCRAQVDYVLATPGCFIPTVGYPAIDYGAHFTSNGQRYVGAMKAKVAHRVINQGLAWKPLIMERASLRGRSILIDCHVPFPPIRSLPVYVGMQRKTYDTLGFRVVDEAGNALPMASVAIVGETQIRIILNVPPSEPVWVNYGSADFEGNGNIFDSDPATTADVYEWVIGAAYSERNADVGKPFALPNPMINYAIKTVEG